MAFNGYLIQMSNNGKTYNNFFSKFISAESYKVSKKILDVDSYRDANGVLHRNPLEHSSYTISFDTNPLDNIKLNEFLTVIRESYSVPAERKVNLTFYVPEVDDYVTQDCYMPDIEFPINYIENNVIKYDRITIKFIGY